MSWLSRILTILFFIPHLFVQSQVESEFGDYAVSADSSFNGIISSPKFVLRTNPMSLLLSSSIPIISSEVRIVGEYIVNNRTGIVIGASYLGMSPIMKAVINSDTGTANSGYSSSHFRLIGYRFQCGYRFYFKKKYPDESDLGYQAAPDGFYVYPRFSYSTSKFLEKANPNDYLRLEFTNVTLNFGRQWLIGKHFIVDLFFGMGYKNNRIYEVRGNNTSNFYDPELEEIFLFNSNFKINLGTAIGIAF